MKLKIRIQKKDIRHGEPNNTQRCPIALAAKRSIDQAFGVDVTKDKIFLRIRDQGSIEAALPKGAQTFIRRFDKGEAVVPFAFEVNV